MIFDLDGTLLDLMDVWEKIDICFLQKRGLPVPADYVTEICARSFEEAAQRLGAAPQHCLVFEDVCRLSKAQNRPECWYALYMTNILPGTGCRWSRRRIFT